MQAPTLVIFRTAGLPMGALLEGLAIPLDARGATIGLVLTAFESDRSQPPEGARGSFLKAYREWLVQHGLLAQVLARMPAHARAMLETPPPATTFVPLAAFDHVVRGLAASAPEATLERMGYESTRNSIGPTLAPIIQGVIRVFGATPSALFGRLELTLRWGFRGVSSHWEAQGERSGALELRYATHTPPREMFLLWCGGFRFAFDVCRCDAGTVVLESLRDGGRTGRYLVRW